MAVPKSILTVSLAKHLTGEPVSEVIAKDWKKANQATSRNFDNVGFDVDFHNFEHTLRDLRGSLHQRQWDGVLIGWCLRGEPPHTEMFERVIRVCFDELQSERTKVMFCTGPDDLVTTVRRNFPEGSVPERVAEVDRIISMSKLAKGQCSRSLSSPPSLSLGTDPTTTYVPGSDSRGTANALAQLSSSAVVTPQFAV